MLEPKLKFNGIYDKRTVKFLNENNVYNFSLDFRPRSLNFIQIHLAQQIVKSNETSNFFLEFENEKEFVISKVLREISDLVPEGKLYLEFSDHLESKFYEQFNCPYYLHIDSLAKINSEYLSGRNLKGVIFDGKFLASQHLNGSFSSLINNFYSIVKARSIDLELCIFKDWTLDLFPSIEAYFDFDKVCLPINSNIEKCFRNVDLNKIKSELKHLS